MTVRVAPEPISSGVSFRSLPRATITSLLRVCEHYEGLGAGTYGHPSKATRYVYDMVREVRALVAGLEEEGSSAAEKKAQLENVVSEWDAVFGSLSSAEARAHFPGKTKLTPKSLYNTLVRYADRITQLEATLARMAQQKADHASRFETALKAEAAAGAARMEQEVRKAKEEVAARGEAEKGAMQSLLEAAEARYVEACRDVFAYKSAETAAVVSQLEEQLELERASNIELGKENELLLKTLQDHLQVHYAASEARWQATLANSEEAHAGELRAQAEYYESLIDSIKAALPPSASSTDKRLAQLLHRLGSRHASDERPKGANHDYDDDDDGNGLSWRSMYEAKRKELAFQLAANAALVKELSHVQASAQEAEAELRPALLEARTNEALLGDQVDQLRDMIKGLQQEQNNAHLATSRTAVSDLRVPWALPYVSSLKKQRRNAAYAPQFVTSLPPAPRSSAPAPSPHPSTQSHSQSQSHAHAHAHAHERFDQLRVIHH